MSTCVIYNRVSSLSQNEYNKSVSLQAQEQMCLKFAHENKLHVKSIFKEVHSAFNRKPQILSEVINRKNQIILIACIDRYSRNVSVGLKMATTSFKNNNKLVFIQEKCVCETHSDLILLKRFLQTTENESKTIGNRIKQTRTFLINNGMFAGGAIPYGYNVVERKLVKNEYEQSVIEFIKLCMKDKLLCDDLNRKMSELAKISPYVPINCYDKGGNKVGCITEPLTKQEIADLLNSYGVLKRGILWCPRVIKTAIKTYDPKVELGNTKLKDWNYIKQKLDDIPMDDIKNDAKNRPNNLGLNFENLNNVKNHKQEQLYRKKQKKLRRSSRLNPQMEIDQTTEETDNSDIEMKEDIQLFKQFTEFNRFKRLYRH